MARVFYIHWHKEEALDTVRVLRSAKHVVRYHSDTGEDAWKLLKAKPPEVLVISLDRLPSHGRRIAAVVKETKKLKDVRILFIGGAADKVKAAQKEFPDACFCSFQELADFLREV